MTTFACNPEDHESLPWVAGCETCDWLSGDPEPGLFIWVAHVAKHFEHDHQITLVGA